MTISPRFRAAFFAISLVGSILADSPANAGAGAAEARRPNVLLILADDLGYSDLGCYGGEIRTPNLDMLAANGLRFSSFYNGARCCPSRAALMTGLYSHQAGVGEMNGDRGSTAPAYRGFLQPNAVTIAQVLKSAGYRAYHVGKWHLTLKSGPIARGFDEFYGMVNASASFWEENPRYVRLPEGRTRREYAPGSFYSTDAFGDYALDFLAQARSEGDRPWFLYLAFNAPHFPLHAPREEIAKYADHYEQGWDAIRERRFARQKALGIVGESDRLPPRSVVEPNWANGASPYRGRENPAWASLDPDRRRDLARRMAVYAGMVDRMDQNIGRIIDNLKDRGELDNTLILFLSDNGACAEWDPYGFDKSSGSNNDLSTGVALERIGGPGTHQSYGSGWACASNTPWRLYKHYGHEGGISTPLIAHWPAGIRAKNEWRRQVGHIIDVMPTLVEATGAKYPETLDGVAVSPPEGRSLIPAFENKPIVRDYLAWEHEGNRALRSGKWKVSALRGRPWELFDIERDRYELVDLASRMPEKAEELSKLWDAWAKRCRVLENPPPEPGGPATPAKPASP